MQRQPITVEVLDEEYQIDVHLNSQVRKIVNRYHGNGYFKNIKMQDVKVYDKNNQLIPFDTPLQNLKRQGQEIFLKLKTQQFEMAQKSRKTHSDHQSLATSRKMQRLSASRRISRGENTMKVEKISEILKQVPNENFDASQVPPQINRQLSELNKKFIQSKHKLSTILQKVNELSNDDQIDEDNVIDFLEEIKFKLSQRVRSSQPKSQEIPLVLTQSKFCGQFFNNKLRPKYEAQILFSIEKNKNKTISKIHGLFHYNETVTTDKLTFNFNNYSHSQLNILILFQSQKLVMGVYTSKERNQKDILFCEDDDEMKAFKQQNLVKNNPFSCLVLGNYEVQIIADKKQLKLIYHQNKKSQLNDYNRKFFEKLNGKGVKSIEILAIEFKKQLVIIDDQ